MPRMLGDLGAFVVINPDTREFRAKADAQIKRALAGLKPTVPLGIDTEGITNQIRLLQARIRQLGLADFLDINIPVGRLITQIQLIRRLLSQAKIADLLEVNLDRASLARQLALIQNISETIPVKFDIQKIPVLGTGIEPVRVPVRFDIGKIPRFPVGGATEDIGISVSGITSAAAKLAGVAAAEKLVADSTIALNTQMGFQAMQAGIAAVTLSNMGQDLLKLDTALKTTAGIYAELAAADTLLAGQNQRLSANFREIAQAQNLVGVAAAALAGGKGGGGGGLAGLTAGFLAGGGAIGGWGGKLSATIPILGLTIRSVAAWHIVLDLIIEALIAVGLAVTAVIPGLLVLANIGQDLQTHFTAVRTVFESLHQAVGPLTGQFDALAHAMAPQAIEILGGAMNAVSGKTGLFADAATRVITLFDDWVAKIDIWANAQSQMGKFITAGIGYLSQFAAIIGNVVSALGNLLTKDPGIARYLLDIINGAALLLKAFSDLPGPVVYATLALHGIYIWASVITPLLINATLQLVKMGLVLAGLAVNPLAWLTVAAAAIAYVAYASGQATPEVKGFIDAINQKIAGDTATQAIRDIAAAIGQLDQKIQQVNLGTYIDQYDKQFSSFGLHAQATALALKTIGENFGRAFRDIPQSLASWPNLARTIRDFGHAIASIFSPGQDAAVQAQKNNLAAYRDEITKLISQQGVLFRVAGLLVTGNNALTKSSYSLAEAFALEDLAGVKAGDSFAVARQKVANLIAGYQAMSVQGGILLNSVNAVTFASLQQQSGIANLNSGWTTFISTVTGGASAFSTFQQQVFTISRDLTGIAPAASLGAASINGLNTASLQASSSFIKGVTDANALVNALTLQASAAGLGARGTDMLTAAVKDTVAQLIPMAGSSQAAQAALIALAQQGGAPANITFQQLGKWVSTASGTMADASKAGGPAAQLQAIMGTLAQASSNLTTDVQNLSVALGTQLTQAESAAILLARGGTKPFDDFANAIANTGVNSGTTRAAAIRLGDEFLALANNNVPAAKAQFEAFARYGLGLTQQQADALWNDVLSRGVPALNSLKDTAQQAKNAGLDPAAGSVQNLQRWIDALHGKNVEVGVTATGSGGMTFTEKVAASISSGGFSLQGLAAGGLIRMGTGPTSDDVPALLSRGETVVSAADSRVLAPAFRALGVPGYASGGFAGLQPGLAGMVPFVSDAEAGFARNVEADLLAKEWAHLQATVKAAAQAAAAAAQSALGFALIPGGGSVSGSAAAAQAWAQSQLAAGIYGWGPGQWPPLLSLWNQESGWRWDALNPSSGAYGIPQSLPADKMAAAGPDWQTNPVTQMRWGLAYIRSTYGSPSGAWAHEVAFNWYRQGGLVGAAAGGSVKALREKLAREQAGERMKYFGLGHAFAIGPAKYRTRGVAAELGELAVQQKAELAAYAALAGPGLTSKNLAHLAGVAQAESRTARGWWLSHMPGGHPLFAADLRRYLAQLAGTRLPAGATGVLGQDFASLPLPQITHTYGQVVDVIEAYLQAHAAPFTGKARGGLVMSYDNGGYLPPGLSMAWNGTGRHEPVGQPPMNITLEIGPGGGSEFDRFMLSWMRRHVKLRGAGNVQAAFGAR